MLVGSRWSPRRLLLTVTLTVVLGAVFSLVMFLGQRSPSLTLPMSRQVSNKLFSNEMVDDEKPGMEYIPGWPYGLKINEPETCKDQEVYILNTVTSNPSQVYHREMIRDMWGRENIAKQLKLRTVFIVGAVPSPVTQRHLQEESDKYGDIIQFDFLETRKNLTIKSLAAVQWFRAFCSNATWVLKCDVDAYINFWALLEVLKPVDKTKDAVCARSMSRPVCRQTSKACLPHYVVDPKEYEPDIYPPYCSGFAYVLHKRLADKMLEVDRQRTKPPFWLEDVYVTGLLPRDLHAKWLDVR